MTFKAGDKVTRIRLNSWDGDLVIGSSYTVSSVGDEPFCALAIEDIKGLFNPFNFELTED